jgi:hypothetical protein
MARIAPSIARSVVVVVAAGWEERVGVVACGVWRVPVFDARVEHGERRRWGERNAGDERASARAGEGCRDERWDRGWATRGRRDDVVDASPSQSASSILCWMRVEWDDGNAPGIDWITRDDDAELER